MYHHVQHYVWKRIPASKFHLDKHDHYTKLHLDQISWSTYPSWWSKLVSYQPLVVCWLTSNSQPHILVICFLLYHLIATPNQVPIWCLCVLSQTLDHHTNQNNSPFDISVFPQTATHVNFPTPNNWFSSSLYANRTRTSTHHNISYVLFPMSASRASHWPLDL